MQSAVRRKNNQNNVNLLSDDLRHAKNKSRSARQVKDFPSSRNQAPSREFTSGTEPSFRRKRRAASSNSYDPCVAILIAAAILLIAGFAGAYYLRDESIPYVLNDDNRVYYISLSKLKPYPHSLLYQLYLERRNSSSLGPIFIDRSSHSFRYINDYLCNRKISVTKFSYYSRLQLYSDFLYYHITPPDSLIQLDIEKEKQNRWNERVITLLVNRKLYSVNKDDLQKRMMYYSIFSKPLTNKITFNYEFNSLEVADPIQYFDYISSYISDGVFYVNSTDRNSVIPIRKEFEYFNILFTEKQWNNIIHFDSHFYGSTLISDYHASVLSSWLGTQQQWKLLYRGSRDGFRLSSYHKYCDNQGPTLTLVASKSSESSDFNLMGFFFNVPVMSPLDDGLYKVIDPEAFLFTLKNLHNIPPTRYPCYSGNRTILFSAIKGPIISTCNRSDLHSFFCNDRFNETKACWSYVEKWDSNLIPPNIGSSVFFNTDKAENVNAFSMSEMEVFAKI